MATPERSSAANTFSMRRLAIMKPAVARRSPAMITPPAKRMATTVVQAALLGAESAPDCTSAGLLGEHSLVVIDADAELSSKMAIAIGALAVGAPSVFPAVCVQPFRILLLPLLHPGDVRLRISRV